YWSARARSTADRLAAAGAGKSAGRLQPLKDTPEGRFALAGLLLPAFRLLAPGKGEGVDGTGGFLLLPPLPGLVHLADQHKFFPLASLRPGRYHQTSRSSSRSTKLLLWMFRRHEQALTCLAASLGQARGLSSRLLPGRLLVSPPRPRVRQQ